MSGDKITSVVKNRSGSTIGTMVFAEDGSFSGRMFGTTSFIEVFGESVKAGFVNGIILHPELIPAYIAIRRCQLKTGPVQLNGEHRELAIAKITSKHNGDATDLCKYHLDYWLDNADDDDDLEPAELTFFNEQSA
jgi:hypothetical protein